MDVKTYPFKKIPEDYFYEFSSEGPKGEIKKVVQYHRIEEYDEMIFNLAFGDWNETTKKIDDKIVSNNNDREKILATVAATVIQFIKDHPNAILYVEGSTPARTRLYQIGISKFWNEISQNFDIQGLKNDIWESFQKGHNYDCFLLKQI